MSKRLFLVAVLCSLTFAMADDDHVWEFKSLHGTTKQLREKLDSPTQEMWKHVADCQSALDLNLQGVREAKEATLDTIHKTTEYKKQFTKEKKAKTDLDAAHAAGDTEAALDAGSQYNIAKAAIAKMDKTADSDALLIEKKSFTAGYQKNLEGAKAALEKAAHWRARQILSLQGCFGPSWPATEGKEILPVKCVVIGMDDSELRVLVPFYEETGITQNGAGDGINVINVKAHGVELALPLPKDFSGKVGDDYKAKMLLIGRERGSVFVDALEDSVPVFRASESSGDAAKLLSALEHADGIPDDFLKRVMQEETDTMEKLLDASSDKSKE